MNTFKLLTELIHQRQSIFPASFTGELIPDTHISEILENANNVPNHKNTEPWRFHIISANSKSDYIKFAQQTYKDSTAFDKFKQSKYLKLERKINKSSHIIMIGCKHNKTVNLPPWEETAAVACAVQNIYLSITALGYGGYWSSPGFIIKNAHQYFKMDEGEKCLGVFYLGIPKSDLPPSVAKGNINEKVKWY